jgi:glycosyltransferase involved in cell wall biosynthesis
MNPATAEREPLVSVMMTIHKPHEKFFPMAVRSILRQSLEDFELIIVEDPSPRSGREMLSGMSDGRIRYIAAEQRTCLVRQRNRAIELARGEFVAVMDGDDVAHPERFAKQVQHLRKQPELGVLGSQIAVIDCHDRISGYRRFPLGHDDIFLGLSRFVPICQPSVMFRREVFENVGGYEFLELPVGTDYELWSRWIHRGVRFANHPEDLLFYRIHSDQMKFRQLRETILASLRVKELYWLNHMNTRARLRMLGERMLLHLPDPIVKRLIVSMLYRDKPPTAGDREAALAAAVFGGEL